MPFSPCKVTVMQRGYNKELIESTLRDPAWMKRCDRVKDGQEFIVTDPFEAPEGLCSSAWADIRPHILTMAAGGSFDFFVDPDAAVATCTDPFRPVIFRIERLPPATSP